MKKIFSLFAAVLFAGAMMAAQFQLVNSASDLEAGAKYVIGNAASESGLFMATTENTNNRRATASIAIADGKITATEEVLVLELGGETGAWTFLTTNYAGTDGYLTSAASGKNNHCKVMATAEACSYFTIAFDGDAAVITSTGRNERNILRYNPNTNNGDPLFACYSSGQSPVYLFKEVEDGSTPVEVFNYYLVGSMNDWTPASAYKFAANPGAEGEYMLEVTFAAGDEFKVVYSNGTTIADEAWFPQGENNNYVVNEAGDYTVYFRPEYQEAWGNYYTAIKKVYPLYDVAGAIAAGLAKGTEIEVRGVVNKMQIKGKNFASYGSVCIYVSDANGAEGEVEFYNCYSLSGAKFSTTTPEYDATSTQWVDLTEVEDINGLTIHVGDTVIAHGKYELYNSTHELQQNCYLIYAMVPGAEYPTDINNAAAEQKAVKVIRNGQLFIEKNGVLYNAQGSVVK